jgi:cation:H+ antiporter
VLGFTALIAPTPLSVSPNALDFDLPVMLGVAALCLPVFYSGYRVTRAEGLLLLGFVRGLRAARGVVHHRHATGRQA